MKKDNITISAMLLIIDLIGVFILGLLTPLLWEWGIVLITVIIYFTVSLLIALNYIYQSFKELNKGRKWEW